QVEQVGRRRGGGPLQVRLVAGADIGDRRVGQRADAGGGVVRRAAEAVRGLPRDDTGPVVGERVPGDGQRGDAGRVRDAAVTAGLGEVDRTLREAAVGR